MPNILIICTANICRSPIAEILLKDQLAKAGLGREWTVGSAGTWAKDGNQVPRLSKQLMKLIGHDISRHRSRIVTSDLLQSADLVLTMEINHKEALMAEFVDDADKIFVLTEMVGFPQDIRDPYGGDKIDYRDAIEEISGHLNTGFEKIVNLARGSRS